MPELSSLDALLLAAGLWLLIGLAGLFAPFNLRLIGKTLFPLGALVAVLVGLIALLFLGEAVEARALDLGGPLGALHFRLDALSALFIVLLGFAASGISIFAAGYFRPGRGTAPGVLGLQYHLFLAGMLLVLLADDAYAFLLAWEVMTLASFFLVLAQHRQPEIRHAGFVYLLIAHLGALAILAAFAVLAGANGAGGDFTFATLRAQQPTSVQAAAVGLLALFGFGAKAGLVPLQVWLPEAHPAAPSPVSALMSGVMLKTAVYGLLRVAFDLLGGHLPGWWAVLLLGLGLVTALYAVLHCTVQSEMKRLLAWSSIENMGLIAVALGLTFLFHGAGMETFAALALSALLYHCLAHAGFKSLLFLGTGAVLHATKERSLGRLGGLIHRMPWVAWLVLLGVLAGAGLPPFSGFVSEWLLLQAFLFSPGLPHEWLNLTVPVATAVVVLVVALAGFALVKFYGVIFLGRMREKNLAEAHDPGAWERFGLAWLAALTVLLGIFPVWVLGRINAATHLLLGQSLRGQLQENAWWLLAPISPERASYAPILFLAVIAAAVLLGRTLVHRLYHDRSRRSPVWSCGFGFMDPRMQDTAEGFSQPIRRFFAPVFRIRQTLPAAADEKPRYEMHVEDHFWQRLYLPLGRFVETLAARLVWLQSGRIGIYLLYSFLTLMVLLLVAKP